MAVYSIFLFKAVNYKLISVIDLTVRSLITDKVVQNVLSENYTCITLFKPINDIFVQQFS